MTAICNLLLLFLFCDFYGLEALSRRRRWKRQALPSDNVQVHSFDSNVTIADQVQVISSDSRIELFETNFAAAIWSISSDLQFNPNDEYVKLAAQEITSRFNLKSAQFYVFADSFQLNETTNRKTDAETKLVLSLEGHVNLSLSDATTTTQVEAVDGKMAVITGNTWVQQLERKLTLSSSILQGTTRQLVINSVSNEYNVVITLNGARVGILYGRVHIDISADYRTLVLTSERHRVELKTLFSPFDLTITEANLLIRAPDDNTVVQIPPNSSDINISVKQLSQMTMDKFDGGSLVLQGSPVVAGTDELQLDSKELELNLIAGASLSDAAIHSSSNYSQLTMATNSTRATLVAQHHFVQILGGIPHLLLLTGNVSLDISGNVGDVSSVTLLPAFAEPEDQFANIGPFGNGTYTARPNTGQSSSNTSLPGNNQNETTGTGSEEPGWNNPGGNPGEPNNPGPGTAQTGSNTSIPEDNPDEPNNPVISNPNQAENNGQATPPTPASSGNGQNTDSPFFIGPITPDPNAVENIPGEAQVDGTNQNVNFPSPRTPFPPTGNPPQSTDNFIIGQYGTESPPQNTTRPGFPITATITSIEVINENDIPSDFPHPPDLQVANSTASFLFSTASPIFKRGSSNKREMMEIKLRVNRSMDTDQMKQNMENVLSNLFSSVLQPQSSDEKTRKKRMMEDVNVRVNEIKPSNKEDEVIVQFYVERPDSFPDLSVLASKLNAFGRENLSEKLKYKVLSIIKIKEDEFGVNLLIIISLALLLLTVVAVFVVFRCVIVQKTLSKYVNRGRIENAPDTLTIPN